MIRSFFHIAELETPCVVGKKLGQAFTILSNHHLAIHLLDQKEDADLPDGTVLSQIPAPGQLVKPRQTVFLALSKQPPQPIAPCLYGKQLDEIERQVRAAKLRLKTYFLESVYPTNQCIAQIPGPDEPVPDKIMIAYISKGNAKHIIWPDFTGKSLADITDFLESYDIKPYIIEAAAAGQQQKEFPLVIDQRPLAGSLISINQKQLPIVQLYIK